MAETSISQDVALWSDVAIVNHFENAHFSLCVVRGVPLEETSFRVLKLTTELLNYNESNYTVWQARRKCLSQLYPAHDTESYQKAYKDELDFVRHHCKDSPKCYQVWHHRRWVIRQLDAELDELQEVESELEADQKNMNLWEQRKFLVDYRAAAAAASASCSDSACDGAACTENDGILRKRCLCWFVKEMEFASKMLTLDARNNSAWSFRRVTVDIRSKALVACGTPLQRVSELLETEIRNLIEQCAAMPHNEPCWNVLRSYFFTERQMLSEQQNLAKAFTYSWNDSRFVSKLSEVLEVALKQDASNRLALYVYYLILMAKSQWDMCRQILRRLADVDSLREYYWRSCLARLDSGNKYVQEAVF